MARTEEHMKDCKRLLGESHERVHQFLDQYAEIFLVHKFGNYHRSFLHNRYGLEVVRAKWGHKAGEAARIHITRDYAEMPIKDWKIVDQYFNRAMKYFNNLYNFDPHIHPHIIRGWNSEGFVSIALG